MHCCTLSQSQATLRSCYTVRCSDANLPMRLCGWQQLQQCVMAKAAQLTAWQALSRDRHPMRATSMLLRIWWMRLCGTLLEQIL